MFDGLLFCFLNILRISRPLIEPPNSSVSRIHDGCHSVTLWPLRDIWAMQNQTTDYNFSLTYLYGSHCSGLFYLAVVFFNFFVLNLLYYF